MKKAIEMIADERERQKKVEGWSEEHDDQHIDNELANAAATYAMDNNCRKALTEMCAEPLLPAPPTWPFDDKWWKPSKDNRIKELVKAGALIVAEIERLQRLEERKSLYIHDEYVTYYTANLLKEKGFDGPCEMFFCKPSEGYMSNEKCREWHNSRLRSDMSCTCPTQQMAMQWIREAYKINLQPEIYYSEDGKRWLCKILKIGKYNTELVKTIMNKDSYEIACSYAINYCLEELIP